MLKEIKNCEVPEDALEKRDLADKLMTIGVLLRDYRKCLKYAFLIPLYYPHSSLRCTYLVYYLHACQYAC